MEVYFFYNLGSERWYYDFAFITSDSYYIRKKAYEITLLFM